MIVIEASAVTTTHQRHENPGAAHRHISHPETMPRLWRRSRTGVGLPIARVADL